MAKNKTSSSEDAELVEEIEARAEDAVDDLSEVQPEIETEVKDGFEQTQETVEQSFDEATSEEEVHAEHFEDHSEADNHSEEVHEDHADVVYEEERRSSLASRFLWLLLLLLGGAGLALWGGPKLAPMLPEPLQPMAKYLTPGASEVETSLAEVNTQIASLRDETDAKLEALPAPVAQSDIQASIASAVGDANAQTQALVQETEAMVTKLVEERTDKLAAEVATLSDKIAAADSGEIEGRLASIESKIAGMSTEFSTLQESIGALQASGEGEETANNEASAELNAELAAKMAAYAASLAGLKAEVAEVATQNGEVRQRIDEVEAATARQLADADVRVDERINQADARAAEVEEAAKAAADAAAAAAENAETAIAIQTALEQVGEKLEAGDGFGAELDALSAVASDVEVPEVLLAASQNGIPTSAALAGSYTDAANAAIRSATKADADAGTVSGLSAFLKSQVVTRSLSPQDGDSTDAVLSRMEAGFKSGDLAATLSEADALPEPAAEAMADWLSKARTRAEALAGFDALTAALAAQN